MYLVPGEGGVSSPGGVFPGEGVSGGCMPRGVSSRGVVSAQGGGQGVGVCLPGVPGGVYWSGIPPL